MSTKDQPLNLVLDGSKFCTLFRQKLNTTSVYLNLEKAPASDIPLEVQVIGTRDASPYFENFTYHTTSFSVLPGKKYMLWNTAPANANVRLEFDKPVEGVWSPDSVSEAGCIVIGDPKVNRGVANTHDETFESDTSFCTNWREKNTSSSVYLNLEASCSGLVSVEVWGCNDDGERNCTYRAPKFLLQAGKKYELYNVVYETNCSLAQIRFTLQPGQRVKGRWSPDYIPEADVIPVGGGGSGRLANTSDTDFAFTINGSAETESRAKLNNSSVYMNVTSLSGPVMVKIIGLGGRQDRENTTYKAEAYRIEKPGKYEMYNHVREHEHDFCLLHFEAPAGTTIAGKWSPDFAPDPNAVTLKGNTESGGKVELLPVTNPTKMINVKYISQNGIPTGCESVSAVMVLNHIGIPISTYDFITRWLPKQPLCNGPDPNCAFIGNPYSEHAFGCFAPCLRRAIAYCSMFVAPKVTTGTSLNDLCHQYIDNGIPVIIWATMGMRETRLGSSSWRINYVNEDAKYKKGDMFQWPGNEHCLVLVGYNSENYFVNDPLAGVGGYPRALLEKRFAEQGSQSVVVLKDEAPPKPVPMEDPVAKVEMTQKMSEQKRIVKTVEGALKVFRGISMGAGGVALIAGSEGFGTPLGAAGVAFGAASFHEGVGDIINAFEGKDEEALNIIRDYVFMGNHMVYDIAEFVVSTGIDLGSLYKRNNLAHIKFQPPTTAPAQKAAESGTWTLDPNGAVIYGRYYGEHALERMAPNTIEVRAALEKKALARHPYKGWKPGTKDFSDWAKAVKSEVNPRGIPPIVVEDTIRNTKGVLATCDPEKNPKLYKKLLEDPRLVYTRENVKIIVQKATGNVISVVPDDEWITAWKKLHPSAIDVLQDDVTFYMRDIKKLLGMKL